jgi:hypothetical protein
MYNFKLPFCQFGCTPLHRAASTGHGELCEFLIEEGAEDDAVDRTGQTPLMHAVICENKGVIFLCLPCSRLLCLVYMMHNISFACLGFKIALQSMLWVSVYVTLRPRLDGWNVSDSEVNQLEPYERAKIWIVSVVNQCETFQDFGLWDWNGKIGVSSDSDSLPSHFN